MDVVGSAVSRLLTEEGGARVQWTAITAIPRERGGSKGTACVRFVANIGHFAGGAHADSGCVPLAWRRTCGE
jgi:hypothetical protein